MAAVPGVLLDEVDEDLAQAAGIGVDAARERPEVLVCSASRPSHVIRSVCR